jgi:hypothetical protein
VVRLAGKEAVKAVSDRRKRESRVNAVGKTKRRWQKWQAECRAAIMTRADGRCEGCGREQRADHLAWHHVFGRGKHIAEPLASHPAMGAALCSGWWLGNTPSDCHRTVHANPGCDEEIHLMDDAIERACATWGFEQSSVELSREALIGNARALETMLRDDGTWEALKIEAGL